MKIGSIIRWIRLRVVLTPKEKQAICFIVGAFLLGLATMHYRSRNPRPPAVSAEQNPAPKSARKFERVSPSPFRAESEGEDQDDE